MDLDSPSGAELSKDNNFVLSAKDVIIAYLITKRHDLGKLIVSIKGTITAVSDITRVGQSQIFLVEVDTCLTLIIKDFHLEWHSQIEPGALFVFYSLKLTTVVKGVSKPGPVCFTLSTSSFARLTDENVVLPISLQEWLKQKNMDIYLNDETLGHDVNCDKNDGLINYEGTVTSTEFASSGIFVLDDRIRLMSLSSNVHLIKKRSRLFVYNAHLIEEDRVLYLVCCMKSCLKIHEPILSDDASSTSTGQFKDTIDNKVRIFIQHIIRKYELNFVEIKRLLQLHSELIRREGTKSDQENLFGCLVRSCFSTEDSQNSVKAADMFIKHSQYCAVNNSQADRCRIPQIVDLGSLREDIFQVQSELHSGTLFEAAIKFHSSPNHLAVCSSDEKVLVGQIIMCPEGLVFSDDTYQLQLVILSESNNEHLDTQSDACGSKVHQESDRWKINHNIHHQSQLHLCCQFCFNKSYPDSDAQLMCPILDPWLAGKNICVRKFYTIVENYDSSRTQNVRDNGDVSNSDVCIYLAFSLLDCVLIDKREDNCIPTNVCSFPALLCADDLSPNTLNRSNIKRLIDDTTFTCQMYVKEKQPLTYTGNHFGDPQTYQFRIFGSIINSDIETMKIVSCDKLLIPRSKRFLENAKSNQENSSLPDNSKQNLAQVSKSICASFTNNSSRWFHCISSGHIYKFTSRSNSNLDPFAPMFSNAKLQKVVENCNVRMTVEMPDNLYVERLPLVLSEPCKESDVSPVMQPISLILSESFTDPVVSFCGVIDSRNFAKPLFPHMNQPDLKSPSMTNLKLDVREIAPHTNRGSKYFSLAVYLDSPKTVYTLGLVPGAVVKFHRVERKVSKAGNIYCRFIAVSVAEVVKFCTPDYSLRGKFMMSQNIVLQDLSQELLINIWQDSWKQSQREIQTFLIHCHIDKIFRLSIKNLCSSCNCLYFKKGCKKCGPLTFPVPASNATLLVEDGTCTAIVKVWNTDLVQQLLTLTSDQWQDLAAEALVDGEILIDSMSAPLSSVAIFLRALIESSTVLRPCKMVVKRTKDKIFSTFDRMLLEDFQESEVKIGKNFLKTLSLPRMQLNCVKMSDVN